MQKKFKDMNCRALRYGMFIPLALMITTVVLCCQSYSNAKQNIADDLNNAMIALANENSKLWTCQDTIAALRQMHKTIQKPIIYQASDIKFRYSVLKDNAYFVLALVDGKRGIPKKEGSGIEIHGNRIVSDSIMLIPERSVDGVAIQVHGYADCSMASLFSASDKTLPGILFTLSILSMAFMFVWRRSVVNLQLASHKTECAEMVVSPMLSVTHALEGVKLTPMQKQFVQMLLEAPDMRVDKATLCSSLWDNKSNAEESLYTLVRRTKKALAEANIEIICNRGESYGLRISG